jgi:predicted TIM-barrel fold metal-dependent hydrolase
MPAERLVLVSADCHAGPRPEQARAYVEPRWRDAFDAWLGDEAGRARRKAEHTGLAIYGDEALEDFGGLDAVRDGGMDGAWNSARRQAELEADGIAAEVIFPGGSEATVAPFDAGLMTYQYSQDPAVWRAGCEAYNRWLADFCHQVPGRRAGVALITLDDIDTTVHDIGALRDRGLFGGVLLPGGTGDHPLYHHPRYEPLWAACAELDLPVHTHSGWTPNYGDFPASLGIFLTEISWFAHRPLWLLLWSGVFERHPNLRLVMTEQGATWIPAMLAQLDQLYEMPMFGHLRRQLPLRPSEYFDRQCFVGASFLGPDECASRYAIGVDKLMWGSDYPHLEGTWPHTQTKLNEAFTGVPEAEVRQIIGDTAIDVYGFDRAKLEATATHIGPPSNAVVTATG